MLILIKPVIMSTILYQKTVKRISKKLEQNEKDEH